MKRGVLILALGLFTAVAAFACVYLVCIAPARSLQRNERPELAWLKEEFNLGDAEFKRVSELHAAYLPECQERCRQIDAQDEHLRMLITRATSVTPEINTALSEAGRLRAECQQMMLAHFFQVGQTMPPEQGSRYLAWVKEKAFHPYYGMAGRP